jgi:hypothetical protein
VDPNPEYPCEAQVCYVYGVLAARTSLPGGLIGTGGGAVSLIPHRDLAAAVSSLPGTGALGTREDLLSHDHVVATLAARATVLPLRFGAMVTSRRSVVERMLVPYHDWYSEVLAELDGRAEFDVSGVYVQEAVLSEAIAQEPAALGLRESLRGLPEELKYNDRIRLGELIVHALDAKREADTEDLVHTLVRFAVDVAARPPIAEDVAVSAAFLVADDRRGEFENAVDQLGYRWAGRVRLRLRGPLPPYDFVPPLPEKVR